MSNATLSQFDFERLSRSVLSVASGCSHLAEISELFDAARRALVGQSGDGKFSAPTSDNASVAGKGCESEGHEAGKLAFAEMARILCESMGAAESMQAGVARVLRERGEQLGIVYAVEQARARTTWDRLHRGERVSLLDHCCDVLGEMVRRYSSVEEAVNAAVVVEAAMALAFVDVQDGVRAVSIERVWDVIKEMEATNLADGSGLGLVG